MRVDKRWLAAAPKAPVVASGTACMVHLSDLRDGAPRALPDGEVIASAASEFAGSTRHTGLSMG